MIVKLKRHERVLMWFERILGDISRKFYNSIRYKYDPENKFHFSSYNKETGEFILGNKEVEEDEKTKEILELERKLNEKKTEEIRELERELERLYDELE